MPIIELGVPLCQRCTNFSTWRANVPQGVRIFQLRLQKRRTSFSTFFKGIFQFLNFSVLFNLHYKFQEHLGSSRKFTPTFFIGNLGQASALKVAYIFKAFGAQSCLMGA